MTEIRKLKVKVHNLLFPSLFIVAAALCCFHLFTVICRYLDHEIIQIVENIQNESLPLPRVKLQLDSIRYQGQTSFEELPNMSFIALIDDETFPSWAYTEFHSQANDEHSISTNQISYGYLKSTLNISVDDIRDQWPLRTTSVDTNSHGIRIIGRFDATNYVSFFDSNGSRDMIAVYISSFQIDSDTSVVGVPWYQLLPCEELRISLAFEHQILMHRSNSPCSDDYPDELKRLLRLPISIERFNNPLFAPDLPYDQKTCEALCAVQYWLPVCGCFVHAPVWHYAGEPKNSSLCPDLGDNCTGFDWQTAPAHAINECGCYARCNSIRFRVVSEEKIAYGYGMFN